MVTHQKEVWRQSADPKIVAGFKTTSFSPATPTLLAFDIGTLPPEIVLTIGYDYSRLSKHGFQWRWIGQPKISAIKVDC